MVSKVQRHLWLMIFIRVLALIGVLVWVAMLHRSVALGTL
jgi:hypothetical protein